MEMEARKRPEIGEYVWVRCAAEIYAGRVIEHSKYYNDTFFLQIDRIRGQPVEIKEYNSACVSCNDIVSSEIEKELLRIEVNELLRKTECYQR